MVKYLKTSLLISIVIGIGIYPMLLFSYVYYNLFQEKYGEYLFGWINIEETEFGMEMHISNSFLFSVVVISLIVFLLTIMSLKLADFVKKR